MKKFNQAVLLRMLFFSVVLLSGRAFAQCQANFNYTVNDSTRIVQFNNTSTPYDSLSTVNWQFYSVGGTSQVKNPAKQYSSPGMYLVCLRYNTGNCSDSVCRYIVIGDTACKVDFSYTSDKLTRTVYFTTQASPYDSLANTTWYFWGVNSSMQRNPVQQFPSAGTYTVCLEYLSSNASCHDTVCKQIVVTDSVPCKANFSWGRVPKTNTITFTNNSSGTDSMTMRFGDGAFQHFSAPFSNINHTYASVGTYTACMFIYGPSCRDSVCKVITIDSVLPCNADFTYTINQATRTVQFYNQSTPYDSLASVNWYFVTGGGTSSLRNPAKQYPSSGTYMVCMDYLSGNCWDSACKIINIVADSCKADFSFTLDSLTNVVTFNNLSTGSGDSSYFWNFGDGSTSYSKNPTHQYSLPGMYVVCLFKNDSMCRDSVCKMVTINSTDSCNAYFTWGRSSDPSLYDLTNYSKGPGKTYTWFRNGSVYSHAADTQISIVDLPATICLTITGSDSCVATYCDSVYNNIVDSCSAYFTWSAADSLPRLIKFVNHSTGIGKTYIWEVNDSVKTHMGNLTMYFSDGDSFYVCLTVIDQDSCVAKYCENVFIGCYADFTYNIYPDSIDGTKRIVVFSNTSASGMDTALWNFGDGSGSSIHSPMHYYNVNGTYNVCLFMINPAIPCADSVCKLIYIGPDSTSGIGNINNPLSNINVYPVPVKDVLKLSFDTNRSEPVVVMIYNTIGVLQYKNTKAANNGGNEIEIDVSHFSPGVYFVELKTESGTIIRRIIK